MQEAPWRYSKVTKELPFFWGGGGNEKLEIIWALCVFLFTLQKYKDGPGTPMGSATLPTQRLVFCVQNHGKTTKANGLNFEDNFILAITIKLVQMFQFCFHCWSTFFPVLGIDTNISPMYGKVKTCHSGNYGMTHYGLKYGRYRCPCDEQE